MIVEMTQTSWKGRELFLQSQQWKFAEFASLTLSTRRGFYRKV